MPVPMASSRGPTEHASTLAPATGRAFVLVLGVVGATSLACARASVCAQAPSLDFARVRTATGGTGSFEGRAEARLESGTIAPPAAGQGRARLRWRIREQGRWRGDACAFEDWDLEVPFDAGVPALARAVQAPDGRALAGPPFGLLLRISPEIEGGTRVRLDAHDYLVTRGLDVDVAGTSVPAILLEANGHDQLVRDEGILEAQWTDALWFDEASGWVLRRERSTIVESDVGGYEEQDRSWVVRSPILPPVATNTAFDVAGCEDPRVARSPAWLRVGVPVTTLLVLVVGVSRLRVRLAGERT